MLQNKKSLGQNWLKDRDILLNIADSACVEDVETVVEIGAGLGTLTSALFKFFERVISVEFDEKLATNLPKSFPGKNLTVINQDILSLDFASLNLPERFVVAGNIPYYITSPIIQKILTLDHLPQKVVFLVQKEVAERIAAEDGDHSVLSIFCQSRAKATLGTIVDKRFFTPPPKVDSRVIILEPYAKPLLEERTMSLVKLGFIAPRKKLLTNLAISLKKDKEEILAAFAKCEISENARPSDLSINNWAKLEEHLIKL